MKKRKTFFKRLFPAGLSAALLLGAISVSAADVDSTESPEHLKTYVSEVYDPTSYEDPEVWYDLEIDRSIRLKADVDEELGKIVSLDIVSESGTFSDRSWLAYMGDDKDIPGLYGQILEQKAPEDMDTVTGATLSSKAIIDAYKDIVAQAAEDGLALAKEAESTEETETETGQMEETEETTEDTLTDVSDVVEVVPEEETELQPDSEAEQLGGTEEESENVMSLTEAEQFLEILRSSDLTGDTDITGMIQNLADSCGITFDTEDLQQLTDIITQVKNGEMDWNTAAGAILEIGNEAVAGKEVNAEEIASEVMDDLKQKFLSGQLGTEEQIISAIGELTEKYGFTLNEEQTAQLIEIAESAGESGFDWKQEMQNVAGIIKDAIWKSAVPEAGEEEQATETTTVEATTQETEAQTTTEAVTAAGTEAPASETTEKEDVPASVIQEETTDTTVTTTEVQTTAASQEQNANQTIINNYNYYGTTAEKTTTTTTEAVYSDSGANSDIPATGDFPLTDLWAAAVLSAGTAVCMIARKRKKTDL